MNNVEQYRKQLLERLQQSYEYEADACIMQTPEDGLPTNILNMLFTDMGEMLAELYAEVYFLPVVDIITEYHIFTVVYHIENEIDSNYYGVLESAMNELNYYFPMGGFVLDKQEGVLSYKYAAVIPAKYDEDMIFAQMDAGVKYTKMQVETYISAFIRLARGVIGLDEFRGLLPQL